MKFFKKEERMKKWERTRKNIIKFILVYGVVKWLFIMFLIDYLFYQKYPNIIIPTIIYSIIGILDGLLTWHWQEKEYKKYEKNNS